MMTSFSKLMKEIFTLQKKAKERGNTGEFFFLEIVGLEENDSLIRLPRVDITKIVKELITDGYEILSCEMKQNPKLAYEVMKDIMGEEKLRKAILKEWIKEI